MSVKLTGAEFVEHMGLGMSPGWWYVGPDITVNGKPWYPEEVGEMPIQPMDTVLVSGGMINSGGSPNKSYELESYLQQKLRRANVYTMTVTCPWQLKDKLRSIIKEVGGKIV